MNSPYFEADLLGNKMYCMQLMKKIWHNNFDLGITSFNFEIKFLQAVWLISKFLNTKQLSYLWTTVQNHQRFKFILFKFGLDGVGWIILTKVVFFL